MRAFMLIVTTLFIAQIVEAEVVSDGAETPPAPEVARVQGRLRERGTRKPIAGIPVFLLPSKLRVETDARGNFVFQSVPIGQATLVVNASGYRKLEHSFDVAAGEHPPATFYLERVEYGGLEATVRGRVEKRDDTTRSLQREQFLTVPGAQGDPVKAVQNLPGIARASAGRAQVIIQGSSPNDTSYLLDDHPVPLVFHFGGLTSVVTPEAIDQVDYLSAGFGPEYGRAIGGIIGLRTRDPDEVNTKGFVFADTVKAGGLIEGPSGERGSYLLTARYSYLGAVLRAVLKDQDRFDLTVAPSFADLTGLYKYRLSENDQLRVLGIGSSDQLEFLFKEPLSEDPKLRGEFRNKTTFYRLIPQWERRHQDGARTRVSLGFGRDAILFNAGDNYFDLKSDVLTQRAEHEWKLRENWMSVVGADNEFSHSKVDLRLPVFYDSGGVNNPISSGETQDRNVTRDDLNTGVYWRNRFSLGSGWSLTPAVRADHFSAHKAIIAQPRLAARWDRDEFTFWRLAGGLYAQPAEPQEIDAAIGNPDIRPPKSWHISFGRDVDFRRGSSRGWSLSSGVFYRYFDDLVVQSGRLISRNGEIRPERYANNGSGDAYGAELLVKAEFAPWSGWISYTLSRSVRREPGVPQHPHAYDQTHNVNLLAARDLRGNWKISGRVRYVTGNPTTPIVGGIYDADNDVYTPVRGAFYSRRLEPFFQVDLRVDKKWIYDTWILSSYVDIQNLTNRANTEGVRYAYDYSTERKVSGLPLLPTLGLRGDF